MWEASEIRGAFGSLEIGVLMSRHVGAGAAPLLVDGTKKAWLL